MTSEIKTITDLANLKEDPESMQGFRKKHDVEFDLSDGLAKKYGKDSDERLKYFHRLAQRLWSEVADDGGIDQLHEILFLRSWPGANLRIDWRRERIGYKPQTTLEGGFYALLTNNHLAKRCANPECETPFFIAERVDERYCSTRCTRIGRLASKREWMREARRK